MTSERFAVSLQDAPEQQSHVKGTEQALQQTFTGRGFERLRDKDCEISVAVLDAMDAIQRERHKRRASAFGRALPPD